MSSLASRLLNAGFEEIRLALDEAEVSASELARESLRRAHAVQTELNAFISIYENAEVLAAADRADARLRAGERNGVLGMPIVIKDLILTKGHLSTAASKMLEGFVPPYDATVVERLVRDGAVVIGKANLDEFAMGSSNESSYFGACRNPWDPTRVPGGSSGGSGAAVGARVAPFSLGTDTGGSIRLPASFCGITGLKPTYGRVSRYGVVAFASSLDQVGPMCGDALGCAAVLESISGRCVHDATSSSRPVPAFLKETRLTRDNSEGVRGLRIGLPKQYFGDGLSPDVGGLVREALARFEAHGAQLVEIDLPHTKYALPVYYLICTSEASSNLARYDGIHFGHRTENFKGGTLEELYALNRGEGFGDEVKRRILLGTYALSSGYYEAYYRKASQVRALIRQDFECAFELCEVIAGPTSPSTAFRLGEKTDDPLSMYLSDVYTLSLNLAGLPGLSLNVGFDEQRLPVGLQLMAPWWEEARILGAAAFYQQRETATLAPSPLALRFAEGA